MKQALETAERWQLLETLFHRALDLQLSDSERIEKAREWCRDDPELLTLLLEMFVSDSSVERLLHSTAAVEYEAQRRQAADRDQPDRWLGKILGPFQVECLLGRGGMGVVYLGRRISGGFTQSVAIKLIARHLSGGPAVRQFHRERDALAKLEHRNIARLLDAGLTAEETPYVAMEYVEGRQFDEACDDATVSLEVKLRWMLQLCDAVSYVHRNLILHRDLKPGNVMVTSDGVVKLLDFGTLKLIGPAAQLSSEMTQAGMRPMTLRYASPEHIAGEAVSTATDVYSLGMILYRIVAGRLPKAVDASSLPEHIEILRNAQAEPPSSYRRADQVIPSALAKDLDAIALKSIRFEPEQRYGSAEALAADIRLCLEQRPVTARRGTSRYLAAKFYARNRAMVLATTAVLMIVAIALLWMRSEAAIAHKEQQRAEARIEEERKLAHLLLFDYFTQLQDIPGSTDAQRKAVDEAVRYLDELSQSSQSPELQLDTVQAYQKMGLLLGSPYVDNLGDAPGAIRTLQKATVLAKNLLALDPQNLEYRVAFIDVQKAMAQAYFAMDKPEASLALMLPAVQMARSVSQNPRATAKMLILCAQAWKILADTYGQHANAVTQNTERQVAALQESGADYEAAHSIRGILVVKMNLGFAEEDLDADRAIAAYESGIKTIASLAPAEQSTTEMIRQGQILKTRLATAYILKGRGGDAAALCDEVRGPLTRAIAIDPIDTRARDDLISLDSNELEAFLAAEDYRRALEPAREFLDNVNHLVVIRPDNPHWRSRHIYAVLQLAKVLEELGDRAAAVPYIEEGLPKIVSLADQSDADTDTLRIAADALLWFPRYTNRDPVDAIQLAQRSIAANRPPSPDQFLLLEQTQYAAGRKDEAVASAQETLAQLKAHPNSTGNALYVDQVNRLLHAIHMNVRHLRAADKIRLAPLKLDKLRFQAVAQRR